MRPYTVINDKSIKVLVRILRGLDYNTFMFTGRTYRLQKQMGRKKFEAKFKIVVSKDLPEEIQERLEAQILRHMRKNLWLK